MRPGEANEWSGGRFSPEGSEEMGTFPTDTRYVKIRSTVNPYDPKWELYLEARQGWQLAQTLAGRSRIGYLWKEQKGRCRVCGQPLRIAEEDCQTHHRIGRSRGGQDTADNMELLHANCHRQIHVRERRTEAAASREGRS
jgi:RNA-directed DNA polymerase